MSKANDKNKDVITKFMTPLMKGESFFELALNLSSTRGCMSSNCDITTSLEAIMIQHEAYRDVMEQLGASSSYWIVKINFRTEKYLVIHRTTSDP